MYIHRRRPQLSQHFLHDRQLVKRLVQQANFSPRDTVLEIGPGKGIITEQLVPLVHQVVAIELDTQLVTYLRDKFELADNILLFAGDFLQFSLPVTPYQIISNTPFAIEGKIIRVLLEAVNPPQAMHLVLRRDVAERWAGVKGGNEFSMIYRPWFEFKITYAFSRFDFKPVPNVESVMLRVTKRREPLLAGSQRLVFKDFVKAGFRGGSRLPQNLRGYLSQKELTRLGKQHGFATDVPPSYLGLDQWLTLFKAYSKSS